jgi:hypothetical protein
MKLFSLEDHQCKKGRKDYDKYQHFKPLYDEWTKAATVAISPAPEPQPVTDEPAAESLEHDGWIATPQPH